MCESNLGKDPVAFIRFLKDFQTLKWLKTTVQNDKYASIKSSFIMAVTSDLQPGFKRIIK